MSRSSAARTRKHREKLRAQGLRPVQIWTYDTRSPEFLAEVRRQSLLVRDDPSEREIMDWLDAVQADLLENDAELKS